MPVDHNRPLPVAPERLISVARQVYPFEKWPTESRSLWPTDKLAEVYRIALLGEQVEQAERANFFLQEAYEIYNARFR